MQSEESVEIESAFITASRRLRYGDLRSSRRVILVAEWNDHRDTVGCAALKDRDQDWMIWSVRCIRLRQGSANKEGRRCRKTCERNTAGFQKIATCEIHNS